MDQEELSETESAVSSAGEVDSNILAGVIAGVIFLVAAICLLLLILPIFCVFWNKTPEERVYVYQLPDLPAVKIPEPFGL